MIIIIKLLDWLNSYGIGENFFKNFIISSLSIALISSIYLNYKFKKNIDFYENKINMLKTDFSCSQFDNRTLNSEILDLQNKISIFEKNSTKLENINNWNYLFSHDLFKVYFESEEFADFIYFDHQSFISLTTFKLMQIELLEYRTKIALYKIIYGPKMHWSLNNFNIPLIEYEIKLFFNKTKYLYCDFEMNNLLFKKYSNTYPLYEPFYTPLRSLLKNEHVPYSFSPEYTNKYYFNNLYYELNYINRDIEPFE